MSESFDPYHQWLGVGPEDQPVNHYRLLGIPLFEEDPTVIANASDRQMAHLKTFQTGKQAMLCQTLLNEVAAARVCLLRPERKSAYDRTLRAAMSPAEPAVEPKSRRLRPMAIPLIAGTAVSAVLCALAATAWFSRPAHNATTETPVQAVAPTRQNPIPAPSLASASPIPNSEPNAKPEPPPQAKFQLEPEPHRVQAAPPVAVAAATETAAKPKPAAVPSVVASRVVVTVEDLLPQPFLIDQPDHMPEYLRGATLYWYRTGEKRGKTDGVLKFKVQQGGAVILVASYGHEGNGGAWTKTRLTREQLSQRGWQELGAAPWDNKAFIFCRMVNPGESYEIRTNKYHPPKLLLPEAGKSLPVATSVAVATPPGDPPQKARSQEPSPVPIAAIQPSAAASQKAAPSARLAHDAEKPLPPPAERQNAVLQQLAENYRSQPVASPTAKRALAAELSAVARKSTDPVETFVLWRKVMELAAESGDAPAALAAIDAIAERFRVDGLSQKAKILTRMADELQDGDAAKDMPPAVLKTLATAVEDHRYDIALDLLDAAQRLSKSADVACRKQLAQFRMQLQPQSKLRSAAEEALERLKTDAADADAHLTVGRWYSFGENDWPRGLPHFAQGSDESFAAAAKLETAGPKDASEAMACGDAWWNSATEAQAMDSPALRQHARTWYLKARPDLTGLALQKVEARLSEPLADAAKAAEVPAGKEKPVTDKDRTAKGRNWSPVPAEGILTECQTLGPFAQTVPDATIVSFILKSKPNAEVLSRKIVPARAQPHKGEQRFLGPAENNTKMFYIFHLKTEHPQNVDLNCNTETRYKQSDIAVLVDALTVLPQGVVQMKRGQHLLIVRQNHHKSDRPDNSWVTVTVRGEGLEQGL